MKIAIDASAAAKPVRSGVATATVNMLAALARLDQRNQYLVCYRLSRLKHWRRFYRPDAGNFRIKLIQEPLLFPRQADVFHGDDARLPNSNRVLTTVRVHDVFSLLRDDFATQEFVELKTRRYRDIAARADRIIASSESTKSDLVRELAIAPGRIVVIHLGVSDTFCPRGGEEIARVLARYGIRTPYALAVARFSKRKNMRRVLEAYAALGRLGAFESTLVLVGDPVYWKGSEQTVEALGLADRLLLTGYVPDDDLAAIYSAARMFIFPSLCEGFGLPLVEAMACGTPVITSNVSSMPEVVGDAALLVDPENEPSIRAQMAELDANAALRERLSAAGIQRAKLFSWDRAAAKLLDLWEQLVATR
jgi:glycosyltransferase involved in cell wall biosynthesis